MAVVYPAPDKKIEGIVTLIVQNDNPSVLLLMELEKGDCLYAVHSYIYLSVV